MDSWLTIVVDRLWCRLLLRLEPLLVSVGVAWPLATAELSCCSLLLLSFSACVSLISSKVAGLLLLLLLLEQCLLKLRLRLCLPVSCAAWPEEQPPLMELLLVVLVPLESELSEISELGRRMLPLPGSVWRSLGAIRIRVRSCFSGLASDLLLFSCVSGMERSLIWLLLGRMSRQGLLPMPMEDISARRMSAMILIRYQESSSAWCTHLDFVSPASRAASISPRSRHS